MNCKIANTIKLSNTNCIRLIGSGNVWIQEDFSENAVKLAQKIILESYTNTTIGQLETIVFDYNLRGIVSPFSSLIDASSIFTINNEDELNHYLDFLRLHIQGVNNIIGGRSKSLGDYCIKLRKFIEGFKLVVIAADLFVLDDKLKEKLSILFKSGPLAGVSFLIISPCDPELEFLSVSCQAINTNVSTFFHTPDQLIDIADNISNQIINRSIDIVDFGSIQSFSKLWQHTSIDGLKFCLGKYGAENYEVEIGNSVNQKHNIIITGAVGQGKSNVISVIIHSLCQRYSPDELSLYLLDFKEGVTLKRYAGSTDKDWLVHAKALGLESDVTFGISILDHLFEIYKQRLQLFKQYGVQSIKEYREKTKAVLSRIVIIIDEFQIMLENKESESEVASKLSRCARLFRAAGIHIILASQTLVNGVSLGRDSDLFSQIPIRIALKNSISESEAVLGSGNVAATDLKLGQAIVNLDYGAKAYNKKISVAFAEESYLKKLRHNWWKLSKQKIKPYVFDGGKIVNIFNFKDELLKIRRNEALANKCLIGQTISENGHALLLPLTNEYGRNVAIIGSGTNSYYKENFIENNWSVPVGLIQTIAVSLALQDKKGISHFIICDLLSYGKSISDCNRGLVNTLQNMGFLIEICNLDDFKNRLSEIANNLETFKNNEKIYIICFGIDKAGNLGSDFESICSRGSICGIHVISWWQKFSRYEEQIGFGNDSYFDIKILMKSNQRDVQRFLGEYGSWTNQDNRITVSDSTYLEKTIKAIPVMPIKEEEFSKIINILL